MFRARGVVLGGVCFAMLAGIYGGAVAPLPVAAAGPVVSSVAPAAGPSAGGTSIVITGTGFTGVTAVMIGATPLTSCPTAPGCYTFVSDTEIDAMTPAVSASTVDITVTVGGVTSAPNPSDQFSFFDPPTVATVATPQPEAATGISVTGTNFSVPGSSSPVTNGVSEVDLIPTFTGGTPVTVKVTTQCSSSTAPNCFSFINDSSLTLNLPTSTILPGQYDTEVITPGGTSATSSTDHLVVQQAVPTVTLVSPNAGPAGGGPPTVAIQGTDFMGSGFTTSAVSFGATAATAFTVNSSSSITATPPAGSGQVDIKITTQSTDTTSTQTSAPVAADTYAYAPVPTVTTVAPGTGPTVGGNIVTLTGTGFMSNNLGGANFTTTKVTVDTTDITTTCSGSPSSPCFTVTDATHISVQDFPAHAAGTVDITVTTPGGPSATVTADQYTYAVLPTVTSVTPGAGPPAGGNMVVVAGSGFTGATDVVVGGRDVTATPCVGTPTTPCFTVTDATHITVQDLPSHAAATVDITVQTPGGTSAISTADQYVYASAPTVTGVSPSFGPLVGGNTVTLTGTGFDPGGVGASQVSVGGNGITVSPCTGSPTAPCFMVGSDTQITVQDLPSGSAGSVDITVTTVGGTSATSGADKYTYVSPPTVTSVAPTSGPTAGGNTVVVTGTGFASSGQFTTTSVQVGTQTITAAPCGGSPTAPCFSVDSAMQITIKDLPSHAVGTVDIKVTTPEGTSPVSQPADQYTYAVLPTVTNVSPGAGSPAGGNTVVVAGTGLTGATDVSVGGTDVTATPCVGTPATPCFTVNGPTQITVQDLPSHAAGTVDITVQTTGGTSAISTADRYVYASTPTVTAVSPSFGPLVGGNMVTLTGTGFNPAGVGASDVRVGAVDITASPCPVSPTSPCFTVVGDTQISVQDLPSGSAGSVDITVTTVGGPSATSGADKYTYVSPPTITKIAPTTGPIGGGTTVVVTGTGFESGGQFTTTSVQVGTHVITTAPCVGTPTAPCFTVDLATQITIQDLPPNAVGPVDITATTPEGTSAATAADQYTYGVLPAVTKVAPGAGPPAGGNTVILTGSGFTGATDVFVGIPDVNSSPCPPSPVSPCFTVNNDAQITVQDLPAQAAGTVDITVHTPVGPSATSAADQYVYASAPTVTGLTPAFGPLAGGYTVNVIGTGFDPAGVTATNVFVGGVGITTTPCTGSPTPPCFTVVSDTQISVQDFPAGSAGSVDITVTTVGGTSAVSAADQFTYMAPPAVTKVAPLTGPTGGGNTLVVTGTGFESTGQFTTTSVQVGPHTITTTPCVVSPTAPCFTVNSATQITVQDIPPHAVGSVDIVATTPEGTSPISQPADQYTYELIPSVNGISPTAGVVAGGNSVIVTGTLFSDASQVSVGSTNIAIAPCPAPPTAPCFTVNSATQITVGDFPPGAAGTVNITVTAPGGTSPTSAADVYAYAPIPTVTKVSPNHGSVAGGTSVTLTGTGFEPSGTNRNFTTTAVTVVGVATITTSPCPGSPTGPCYNVNSSTQIFIEDFPAHAVGSVDITVTTLGGTSPTSNADRYFYGASFPTVTLVSQKYGAEKGGALLTITGTNFSSTSGISVSDVFFGTKDVLASNAYPCLGATTGCFTVVSPTQITAYTPLASLAGMVDITVTTNIGTSGTSTADQYTYVAPSAYSALTPFVICDTRASKAPDECTGKTLGKGGRLTAQITGVTGPNLQVVPSGAQAVVVNLTAINHSTTITYVTAFPAGSVPIASTVNLDPGAVQSNLAVVQLTSGGAITVYNAVGSVDVIVDVEGFYAAPPGSGPIPGEYHSIAPIRMCDTRANKGTACAGATNNPILANTWRKVALSGTGSVPATGAAAAVFNLTATQGTLATYLAVAPPNSSDQCPTGAPRASNLNPKAGGTLPIRVVSPLGPANDVCVYNAVGAMEIIIDVDGWFGTGSESSTGALFYSVPPTRICDTRSGTGTRCSGKSLGSNFTEVVQVAGATPVPAFTGAQPVAIVANLTGVAGTQSTYLEFYASDAHKPLASDLNPVAHDVIANLVMVGLAQTAGTVQGDVSLYNGLGTINALVDVAGWYQ